MRHKNYKGKLNRSISHRKATLKNMSNSLFTFQKLETTKAKAKALKSFAEPFITVASKEQDSVAARRQVLKKLGSRKIVKLLFDEIGPLYKGINGGYTRIMPLGNRKGDGADMVIIELTKQKVVEDKPLKIKKKTKKDEPRKSEEGKKVSHSAPDVDIADKEEHTVEDVRKQKARSEDKKVQKKGFFKRFRRKSID